MRKKIEKLLQSDIKGTEVENKTGVSRSVITKLRKGQREIDGLTLATSEKLCKLYEEMNLMKKVAVLTDEQVQQLAKKCEGMEDVSITKDFPGRQHITFKNGNFIVKTIIDVNSTKVKAYAWVGQSEFGTEETNVTTVEELYKTVRNYEKYFLTGGEVTRTMLWIKQMFM